MPYAEHHINTIRTARYWTLGELSAHTHEIWFVLHGYGQLGEFFLRNFSGLDDGTRFIVAPEALSRFYLKEFTGRIGATWMTREDREYEIQDYVRYLDGLHDEVFTHLSRVHPAAERVRLCLFGFSQGVTTASRWLLHGTRSQRVRHLICWAGGLPAEAQPDELRRVFKPLQPVFVAGTEDEFITAQALEQQKTLIEGAGLRYELVQFSGGHVIVGEVLSQVVQRIGGNAVVGDHDINPAGQ
jgi:predicted esterase